MKQQKTYRKSRQRERILELLRSTHSHPTATWIYDRLKPEFPSLSMGTVYRNLSILEAQERIVRLSSGSTFDRYDASTHPHAHFRCVKCGNVYDVENTDPKRFLEWGEQNMDHQVDEMFIEFRGLCKHCREKEDP